MMMMMMMTKVVMEKVFWRSSFCGSPLQASFNSINCPMPAFQLHFLPYSTQFSAKNILELDWTNNQTDLCTGCNTRQQKHFALVFMGLIYSINSSIRRYILNISVIAFLLSPRIFFPFFLPACLGAWIDSGQNAKLLECMGRCSAGPTCSIVFSSQLLQEQVGHN